MRGRVPADGMLAQVLEFQRQSIERTAQHVRQIDEGWVFRSPALAEVWTHNQVWVDEPISYAAALTLCQRHLSDARFWQLFLTDAETADRLSQPLRADGWEIDLEIHSVLARDADREVDVSAVIDPSEEESLELMAGWMREDETLHLSRAGVRQMVDKDRAVWRLRNARRYGIRDAEGRLAAITQLFSDGRVGQVEHVYTVPEARGRGYARTLVSHAATEARAAGHELTFIVADDNDWPKHLYSRLGFEPLGRTWLLHLPPSRVAERRRRD